MYFLFHLVLLRIYIFRVLYLYIFLFYYFQGLHLNMVLVILLYKFIVDNTRMNANPKSNGYDFPMKNVLIRYTAEFIAEATARIIEDKKSSITEIRV
ncbi:hypothetical protein SBFV2_gp29 [Sulfolobales Beppu filamentous virus 2]|uniref:Uncharacterized protein n=1 Tax=Sulfolobales Beppu filamentous virus 2 TaxID=2493123 RepID=A0A3Q8Q3Q9_9VIRU|nr:hypothetical protein HOU84_gp29 [Sulfolobales Beppu filamentous virus 2]AZI75796.1 hypothetical protein SBFV2_gp29 [Sulfolobales Beppu filamentous virus 2]